jgi:hypothetical protein
MILVKGQSATGSIGYHVGWSAGDYTSAVKIGYPGDILDGEIIQFDGGGLFVSETGLVGVKHGNANNAGGSSGGAMVAKFDRNNSTNMNYVISVTSHHLNSDATISYGPRIDDGFKNLMEYTTRGCR